MTTLFTIGHSTRDIDSFISLLEENEIQRLIDVRSMPGSRFKPFFNKEELKPVLRSRNISYSHLELLGGRRSGKDTGKNNGWRCKAFRNYANYMDSSEFSEGIIQLERFVNKEVCAIMCAEAVPWRCHRSLISDALLIRGYEVKDIFNSNSVKSHELTSFAVVDSIHKKINYLDLYT